MAVPADATSCSVVDGKSGIRRRRLLVCTRIHQKNANRPVDMVQVSEDAQKSVTSGSVGYDRCCDLFAHFAQFRYFDASMQKQCCVEHSSSTMRRKVQQCFNGVLSSYGNFQAHLVKNLGNAKVLTFRAEAELVNPSGNCRNKRRFHVAPVPPRPGNGRCAVIPTHTRHHR